MARPRMTTAELPVSRLRSGVGHRVTLGENDDELTEDVHAMTPQLRDTGGYPDPHRKPQLPLRFDRSGHRIRRRPKRRAHLVAGVLEHEPEMRSDRRSQVLIVGGKRCASGSVSQRGVDASISVNRNVTVPVGSTPDLLPPSRSHQSTTATRHPLTIDEGSRPRPG
jgi:hypothetical protein